ncbi:hypothetical protein GCM10009641_07300 [Mycobacterium cookii]|uniref:Uncharacterized protein n=1 Tax=Mycobacterium cookii TaxID=1775 RepID=A0A7I7L1L9_9MYCO|nr:DUF5994 family protein [Mycobacterium cookii]MCV7333062.1 hypothetical protein [Mycobacterium cookii]BBX48225.1 hypothetical protein MCOO_42400 [Mycobacterium cookii]
MQNDLCVGQLEVDPTGTRVRVTPNRLASEHIDGAWWPRSTLMSVELPALLSSLSARLGQIVGVGYRQDGWTDTPAQIDIAGHPVQLMGFTSDEPASVIVIGHDGHHLTLRVIAPETDDQAARDALAALPGRADDSATDRKATAAARSVADVADRLARREGRNDDQRTAEIVRWCEEVAEQFESAPVQSFVPILVEHIVRNRMHQSATRPSSD